MGRTIWIVTRMRFKPYEAGTTSVLDAYATRDAARDRVRREVSIAEQAEDHATSGGPGFYQVDTRDGWVRAEEWLLGDI